MVSQDSKPLPINYGETLSGAINPANERDAFFFIGSINDLALVRMTELSRTFDATFRVYRPDGSLLCSHSRNDSGTIERVCAIDQAGAHVIVLSDNE